uniref:Uncharacterized protein n=1 Tax=Nelumbo nucifera TaxID=4432 RepID=A0A822Z2L6_NELNU|nr:TPA_asm: hypothetical protein HUJ06_013595 [Nelumbo nucifera]
MTRSSIPGLPSLPVEETENLKSSRKEAYRVAICTSAIAAGATFNPPWRVPLGSSTAYVILSKAYTVTMFLCLSMSLVLFVLSVMLSRVPKLVPLAKKLMWVVLALVQIALSIGTYIVVMFD